MKHKGGFSGFARERGPSVDFLDIIIIVIVIIFSPLEKHEKMTVKNKKLLVH